MNTDLMIIGAGAAGLAAAHALRHTNLKIVLLEARDRIGGRVFTQRSAHTAVPLELGAEFIHGRPKTTFAILDRKSVPYYEVTDSHLIGENGRLETGEDFWELLDEISADMRASYARGTDETYRAFVTRRYGSKPSNPEALALMTRYVEGFHAGDPERISVRSVVESEEAAEKIEGTRNFRSVFGYDRVLDALRTDAPIDFNTIVERVEWSRGHVAIATRSENGARTLTARAALLTLPLGVWQAQPAAEGAVMFAPELPEKRAAARQLAMGNVLKLVFVFRERFWEGVEQPEAPISFIHSKNETVPTWWTLHPLRTPVLTGWCGGPPAERLSARGGEQIMSEALDSLSRVLAVPRRRLDELLVYRVYHDWRDDVFARGAYSYVPVGAHEAPGVLGAPVEGTLFFAGEATDTNGYTGTVHGALGSGQRAAREIMTALNVEG